MLAKVLGEELDFLGLNPFRAAHAEGKADDNFFDIVFADKAPEKLEVVFLVLAMKCFEALRGDAEGIGDGNADAASSDIEA